MHGESYLNGHSHLSFKFADRLFDEFQLVFGSATPNEPKSPLDYYVASNVDLPGNGGCGIPVSAPNDPNSDYDSVIKVESRCESFKEHWPAVDNPKKSIDHTAWTQHAGLSNEHSFIRWWLWHLPSSQDGKKTGEFYNNWWKYYK